MGMAPPGSASTPAMGERGALNEDKAAEARRAAELVVGMLDRGARTRDVVTRKALENAMAVVMALGGSTNGVLHLLAIAREAEVPLSLAEFNGLAARVPLLGNLQPFGQFNMLDLHGVGGVPAVMRLLLDAGLLHGDCATVTGRTVAEEMERVRPPPADQTVLYTPARPLAAPGRHILVLHGSLAPEGAVLKLR